MLNKIMLFKSWKSYFYALLLHPTEAKILILHKDDSYHLPRIEINKDIWLDSFEAIDNFKIIKDGLEQELSISVNILHYASYQIDKEQRRIEAVYVLEQHNPTEEIQVGIWCDLLTLEGLSFTCPETKLIIAKYLIELESGTVSKFRPPWTQPGWFSEASAWIEEQLEKLEYRQLAPIEYVNSWAISCVLRVKTTAGTIYFKEAFTFPLFCNEPIVTAELANLFSNHIPTVISIDRQRHWMLLEDFGNPIGWKVSFKAQLDIYTVFAQIQIQSVEHIDRLLNVGCLDRRLNILQSQIEPLVNDENVLSGLSTLEIDRLHTLVPNLKNLCSQLASYKIPETLVHGDLHLNNVALNENNYIFFDWTDSCIAHPFFDLFELFLESNPKSFFGRLKGLWKRKSKEHIRDRYLSQWIQYEPKERLLDAWKIAKPLCALHHAITYQHIVPSLEPIAKQQFHNALLYFVRGIIRSD